VGLNREVLRRLAASSVKASALFVQWDVDKSGTITLAEFTMGLHGLGLTPESGYSDAFIKDVFNVIDDDASGVITYNEITATLKLSKRAADQADDVRRQAEARAAPATAAEPATREVAHEVQVAGGDVRTAETATARAAPSDPEITESGGLLIDISDA